MVDWEYTKWWRVLMLDPKQPLYCETSDAEEAQAAFKSCPQPCRLERFQTRTEERWVVLKLRKD